MDEFADEDAVLLTNTSGISIDEIAASTKRPESVLGLHFFYPAPVMKLVEIIRGEKTSDEAFAKTHEFADAIGKTSVDAPNTPGFIVNRVINPYENMGAWLVSEGVSAKDVDTAMKLACNHPMGPCELMDFAGIDVVDASLMNLYEGFDHDDLYRPAPRVQGAHRRRQPWPQDGQGLLRLLRVAKAQGIRAPATSPAFKRSNSHQPGRQAYALAGPRKGE